MSRKFRMFAAGLMALGLIASNPGALAAPPKDKPQHDKQQHGGGNPNAKSHKGKNGKAMLGDKIKQNGRHKLEQHGKFESDVDVQNGKVAGVSVKHSEKGDVPVTKYKTDKDMSNAYYRSSGNGIMLASLAPAQQYVGTTWIGYAFIDDYGEEVIYWFPYDMVLDPYTGAIDYYPAS
jgi:hypothetical protein